MGPLVHHPEHLSHLLMPGPSEYQWCQIKLPSKSSRSTFVLRAHHCLIIVLRTVCADYLIWKLTCSWSVIPTTMAFINLMLEYLFFGMIMVAKFPNSGWVSKSEKVDLSLWGTFTNEPWATLSPQSFFLVVPANLSFCFPVAICSFCFRWFGEGSIIKTGFGHSSVNDAHFSFDIKSSLSELREIWRFSQ